MFKIRQRHLRTIFIVKNCLIYAAACLIVYVIGSFVSFRTWNAAWSPPACWLPALNEYDTVQFDHFTTNTISCGDDPNLIHVHGRNLCMNAARNVSCNWVAFRRKPVTRMNPDSHVYTIGKAKPLNDCVEISNEFVQVRCHDGDDEVYRNVLYFVPNWLEYAAANWSVIVIGLEGVSRMSFRRELPLSRAVLLEMGALEFTGFASATNEPFGNWMTLLSDIPLSQNCWLKNGYLDECDLIWNQFSRKGYRTVFAEDDPTSAFRSFSRGFLKQPVDFYLHTGKTVRLNRRTGC